jgi:hypothetical protein
MKSEEGTSDVQEPSFGTGLCYSLALFLSHEANFKYVMAEIDILVADGAIQFEGRLKDDRRYMEQTKEQMAAIRWLSAASRPIQNLQIPAHLPREIRDRLQQLKSRCNAWAFPSSIASGPSKNDVLWALEEAKELIRRLDELNGVQTKKEDAAVQQMKEPVLTFRDQ